MANILKISEAASLALHSTVLLAANPDKLISTREIAAMLHVSEAHLSKVLQRLTRTGIVRAIRGPRGGFRLVKPANETTLLEVYESIEGTLTPGKCLFESPICEGDACILGGLLETVDRQFRDYLTETKLDDLTSIYRSAKSANA
jgi:Rrf2 family protein